MDPEAWVRIAGMLQLSQLPLMTIAGRKLGWHTELARMSLANQRLFRAIGAGIVIYVMGTGLIAVVHAPALVNTSLGRSLCALQAVAFTARLLQQLFGIGAHIPRDARAFARVATSVYASLALSYLGVSVWLLLLPSQG